MVFPARAGMSPASSWRSVQSVSFPRPRGDEPGGVQGVHLSVGFSPPARG